MENTGDSEDSIQHLKHERHFNEEYKNGSVSEVSTYYLHTIPTYLQFHLTKILLLSVSQSHDRKSVANNK